MWVLLKTCNVAWIVVLEISPTGKGHTASVTEQATLDSSSDVTKFGEEKPTERESAASAGGGRPKELDVGAKKVQNKIYWDEPFATLQ